MLPLWTSHPFEKLLAAEAAAAKLYTDRDYVRNVIEYYATSSDKSTPFLARTVVAHATFDALNAAIQRPVAKIIAKNTKSGKPAGASA